MIQFIWVLTETKQTKNDLKGYMCSYIHCSIIYNNQDMEAS